MKAIIRRELRSYLRNPLLWIGVILVFLGMYQNLSPYLQIHYFSSDEEIRSIKNSSMADAYISEGWIPSPPERQREMWEEKIRETMVEDMGIEEAQAGTALAEMEDMKIPEACEYLKNTYSYFGAEYWYDETRYYQGTAQEVNAYLEEKMEEHRFSYYFARKFADFGGLYMAFFAMILFAPLFLQDTRRNTYELLHTKPLKARQYVLGKIGGGFLVASLVYGLLNVVYFGLCLIYTRGNGFEINLLDFLGATGIYILPNMLLIVCVYALVSLVFRNPLPAVPLLLLYMIYSNMGGVNEEGIYGYYGRPLAIMVRFPGQFFDTALPPMVVLNQTFLVLAAVSLAVVCIGLWTRRRV